MTFSRFWLANPQKVSLPVFEVNLVWAKLCYWSGFLTLKNLETEKLPGFRANRIKLLMTFWIRSEVNWEFEFNRARTRRSWWRSYQPVKYQFLSIMLITWTQFPPGSQKFHQIWQLFSGIKFSKKFPLNYSSRKNVKNSTFAQLIDNWVDVRGLTYSDKRDFFVEKLSMKPTPKMTRQLSNIRDSALPDYMNLLCLGLKRFCYRKPF